MRTKLYRPGTDVIDITAPGGIAALLAFHRAHFGDARMDADGDGDGSDGDGDGSDGDGDGSKVNKSGFPDNTPVAKMTVEQQANYWKHQARKHEDRVKAFGGLTPEQLTQLREKAEKHDKLEYDLASDHEKAITDARTAAAAAAAAMFVPQIVNAQLDAAAARKGVSGEALAKALEFVDHEKFLNDDGAIDAAKVQSFVDGIAPAKGTQPKGPSLTGHSAGGGSGRGSSVAAGREMWAERHKKTTTS